MEREHKDVHSFLGFAIQTPLAVVWLLRRWIAALFPGLGWLQGAWESWKSCEECAEVGHCWTWNCVRYIYCILYMVVSWNRGTPNYPFIEGFSMIYQPLLVQLDTYGKSSYFGYGISMIAVRSHMKPQEVGADQSCAKGAQRKRDQHCLGISVAFVQWLSFEHPIPWNTHDRKHTDCHWLTQNIRHPGHIRHLVREVVSAFGLLIDN